MDVWSNIAKKFGDAVIKYVTDSYGKPTPMFCQIIDLETLKIPDFKDWESWRELTAGWEEDKNYTHWSKQFSNIEKAQYSNFDADAKTIELLYALTKETGDNKYEKAANEYIDFFLNNCAGEETGLFAWGSHMGYNVVTDKVSGYMRHELEWGTPDRKSVV